MHVVHLRSAHANATRVRIDNLNLAIGGCSFACRSMLQHGGGSAVQYRLRGKFAQTCADGMGKGLRGYLGPPCLSHGGEVCLNRSSPYWSET